MPPILRPGHPQPLVTVERRRPCLIVRSASRTHSRLAAVRASQGLCVMARARTWRSASSQCRDVTVSSSGHSPAVVRLRSTKGDPPTRCRRGLRRNHEPRLSLPCFLPLPRTTCVRSSICLPPCMWRGAYAIYQCECAFVSTHVRSSRQR